MPDPLSYLPGSVSGLGKKQKWPTCRSTCSVTPGRYKGPLNIKKNVEILLAPGYYVFESHVMHLSGTIKVDPSAPDHPETGRGVMLYFKKKSALEIHPTGSLQFTPPEDGPFENVAIYYQRSNKNTLGWRASNNEMPGWVYGKNAHLRLSPDRDWVVNNRFVFNTLNSHGGNFTIDPNGWPGWFDDVVPAVTPIFECYIEEQNGSYTAYFGFENLTTDDNGDLVATQIPFGSDNKLIPASFDGAQPTMFGVPNVVPGQPGRTAPDADEPNAFVVTGWDGSDIVWTLNGGSATADLSTNCPSQPPLDPDPDVVPIFECYIEEQDGSYTAYFGYENLTLNADGETVSTTIALGVNNALTPSNVDGTQPVDFGVPEVVDGRPGRTAFDEAEPNAFVVTGWDGTDIVWTLNGATATASLATNCPGQPPLGPDCFGQSSTIVGTDGDDVLVGTNGDDVIFAGLGNDVVDGLGGNDLICGGEGEDVLNGDSGDDQIDGGTGHDVVDGGNGADTLLGDAGDDVLLGGDDADDINGGDGDDAIRGGGGDDTISDNDTSHIDRDSVDGGGGVDVCDVDLDDEEVSC